jgi:hypothetical protein
MYSSQEEVSYESSQEADAVPAKTIPAKSQRPSGTSRENNPIRPKDTDKRYTGPHRPSETELCRYLRDYDVRKAVQTSAPAAAGSKIMLTVKRDGRGTRQLQGVSINARARSGCLYLVGIERDGLRGFGDEQLWAAGARWGKIDGEWSAGEGLVITCPLVLPATLAAIRVGSRKRKKTSVG